MLEFFGVSALLFVAACCAIVYFTNDRALARFRRNPDPTRIGTISKDARQMVWCAFSFFGCFLVIGTITDHIWAFYALAFVLVVLLRAIFGASRKPIPPESLPPLGGGRLPYFMAAYSDEGPSDLAQTSDPRFYKVFIAPAMLACAQVVNRVRKDGTLIPPFWNGLPWKDAMFYDALDVTLPGFCQIGARNFQIALRDITSVECDPVLKITHVGSKTVSGSVTLRLKSGGEKELVLLGTRDAKALRDQLQSMVNSANNTGNRAV